MPRPPINVKTVALAVFFSAAAATAYQVFSQDRVESGYAVISAEEGAVPTAAALLRVRNADGVLVSSVETSGDATYPGFGEPWADDATPSVLKRFGPTDGDSPEIARPKSIARQNVIEL